MQINKENSIPFIQPHGGIYYLLVSPPKLKNKILDLAELEAKEVLYDLGSGDGRIIIEAAKRFNIKAIGIESNRELCKITERKISDYNLSNLVKVYRKDMNNVNLTEPDVIVLYHDLTNLKPLLLNKLKQKVESGSRLITIDLRLTEIESAKMELIHAAGNMYRLYLYKKR